MSVVEVVVAIAFLLKVGRMRGGEGGREKQRVGGGGEETEATASEG